MQLILLTAILRRIRILLVLENRSGPDLINLPHEHVILEGQAYCQRTDVHTPAESVVKVAML